ncbi:MAG: FAD:protein FMN transferase [Myxococcales bacterium]|nr:FAD:protein FMN transferase [Myxococcales bacterium]
MTRSPFLCLCLVTPLLISCGGRDEPEEIERVELTAPPAPPTPRPEPPPLVSRNRELMGTVYVIQAQAPEELAAPAIAAAFDEIARLEEVLSEWRESSEISRINRSAGGPGVEVSADAFRVVEAGVQVSRWSEGAFDLSWAALHGLYDFRPGRHRNATPDEIASKLPLIDWRRIALTPGEDGRGRVTLGRAGMVLGTGSIGKGYALDRAGEILRARGVDRYMLFGGGQVQVAGRRIADEGERPWRVGIQHPRDPESYFAFLEADSGSISTSGDYEHAYIDAEGRRWHHIIDTRTGLPANRTASVTLLAEDGLHADALSTAVFVLGPERGLQMLSEIPIRAEAVIVGADCRVHMTPGTPDRVFMRVTLEEGDRLPGCPSP